MKYDDLSLRLTQLDADLKSTQTRGATSVRKEKQLKQKIEKLTTELAEAKADTAELAERVAAIKLQRRQIISELNTRAEQVQ